MKPKLLASVLTSLALLAGGTTTTLAGSHTWSGAVNGYWSNAGNWSSGGVPAIFETAPVILNFPAGAPNHNSTNDIGAIVFTLVIDQMIISGNNYTIAGINGGTNLILSGYSTFFQPESIYSTGSSNAIDSSMYLYLENTNTAVYVSAGNLYLNGLFAGPGGLAFTGPGTSVFGGIYGNTFTGPVNVQAGTVILNSYYIGSDFYSVYDVDVPSMGGALIVGSTNTAAASASVLVERSTQFGTNCDITVNATGVLEFDRSYLNTNWYFYYVGTNLYSTEIDTNYSYIQNEARSLSVGGGTVYLGQAVFVSGYDYYTGYPTFGTNGATLQVDTNFMSAPSPDMTYIPYVLGPGGLSLSAGCTSWVSSPMLYLGVSCGGFNKLGPGTLYMYNGFQENLTVAQGLADVISTNVSFGYSLAVSNGAQLTISQNCSGEMSSLDLAGSGIGGTGALVVNNAIASLVVQGDIGFHGDTTINVVNSSDQLVLDETWYAYALRGTNNLYKTGAGQIQFLGFIPNVPVNNNTNGFVPVSNIFSGTFYVQNGSAYICSHSNSTFHVEGGLALAGPIVIGTNGGASSCWVELDGSRQLATNVSVTVNPGCELYITGTNTQTVGSLTLNGGMVNGGTLMLDCDVTAQNASSYGPAIFSTLSMNGTNRTINVAPISSLAVENVIDGGNGVAFTKAGAGDLNLYGTDFCAGITVVSAGRLGTLSSGAFLPTSFALLVSSNAELLLYNGVNIGAANLWLVGAGTDGNGALKSFGTNSWAGSVLLATNATIGVISNASWPSSQLELSGIIGGTANLTKAGFGNLIMDGSQSNTYAGTTLVQQGAMTLNKTGGGAIPGPLTIGLGLDGVNGDAVHALANNQLSPSNLVNISSSGLLDIGGSISTSIGSLTGTGTLNLGVGGLTCGLDNSSTAFGGSITGSASGSMLKNGTGAFTLSGVSPFGGIVQCGAGELFVNGSLAGTISFNNGATLGGTGTVGAFGFTRGIVAPGVNGPGILNTGNMLLNSHDTFLADITGTNAGAYSQLNVNGTVTLGSAALQLAVSDAGVSNSALTLIKNNGASAVSGTFTNLPEGATITTPSGGKFKISYKGGTASKDVVLTQTSLPPQPKFTGITNSGGTVQLGGTGYTNASYTVWATTNLQPAHWQSIGTAVATGTGGLLFSDTNAASFHQRFYRFSWP